MRRRRSARSGAARSGPGTRSRRPRWFGRRHSSHRARFYAWASGRGAQHRCGRPVLCRRHRGRVDGRDGGGVECAGGDRVRAGPERCWRAPHGWWSRVVLRLRFGVLEVISTLLLNFVAEALVSLMVQGRSRSTRTSIRRVSRSPWPLRLPVLPGTRLHLGFAAALVAAGAPLVRFPAHDAVGFELRAAGHRPRAATGDGRVRGAAPRGRCPAGIGRVRRPRGWRRGWRCQLCALSQPVAGLRVHRHCGGAARPARSLVGSWQGILFGALEAGAGAMQRDAGVPAVAVYVAEAVTILAVLLADAPPRGAVTW